MSVTRAGIALDDGGAALGGAADDGDMVVAQGVTGSGAPTAADVDGSGSRATIGAGTLATGGDGSSTAAGATPLVAAKGVGRTACRGIRSLRADAGVLGAVGRVGRSGLAKGGGTDGSLADGTFRPRASTASPRAVGALLGTIVVVGNGPAARADDRDCDGGDEASSWGVTLAQ